MSKLYRIQLPKNSYIQETMGEETHFINNIVEKPSNYIELDKTGLNKLKERIKTIENESRQD